MTYHLNRELDIDERTIHASPAPSLDLSSPKNEMQDPYFAAPLKILQVDTIPGFDIYLRTQRKEGHILYRSGAVQFKKEHKDKLLANNVTEIYIKSTERRIFSQYVEDNLTEIVSDHSLHVENKSKIVYTCSRDVLQNIFGRAQIADKIPRVTKVVRNTVEHVCKGIEEFISMLDAMSHDYYTVNHSVNVCIIGIALGQRIGLNRNELNELGTGLLLHDLGKSKIDESILMKKGPLNESEWKIIKNHPNYGAVIAENTKRVTPLALTVIRQHHEKCTGRGYPIGLCEPQIHLFSRIAALADVYDALTTERPYNSALKGFSAVKLMQRDMANDFSRDLFKELVLLLLDRPEKREGK